jgi:cytosine/adenosine deaminase-related metal-dependent hydrolase
MRRLHRAAWVLPISRPPIRDGWIVLDDGRIVAVGGPDAPPEDAVDDDGENPSSRLIMPGLVNAHVHFELSWMRGQVGRGESMPAWAAALIALRRAGDVNPVPGIRAAIDEAIAAGTSLVGDVANTPATGEPIAASRLSAAIFRELIGFRVSEPEPVIAEIEQQIAAIAPSPRVRTTLVPHAPYSVSPALMRALGARAGDRPLSIHLGESAAEIEFLQSGHGPWRGVLEAVGAWTTEWQPPACGPVEYLERLDLLDSRLVAVHGVQLTDDELARLAGAGATLVTCPRSNEWTGAGIPPIGRFYASGVRVAIGTDSLASVDSLSLFDEMAAVRRAAPGITAERIVRSATADGAAALGFDDFGKLEPGAAPGVIAVSMPAGVDAVEEYLVSGIPSSDVTWLSEP